MRLAFVTPRFGAAAAVPAERLAQELAERAPDSWAVSVFTTTAAGPGGSGFREGTTRSERATVHRFPPEVSAAPSAAAAGRAPGSGFDSPALVARLAESRADFDLVVLFGAVTRLAAEAAGVAPERTVLLPFADGLADDDPAAAAAFERAAACVFGSEAEEVALLDRYGLHRRMRETVSGALLLRQAVDPDGFREREGLRPQHLVYPGPLQPGRGVEELLRYFASFLASHPRAALDLVLFAPVGIRLPSRPEIRAVVPEDAQARLDAIGGALLAVLPARLSSFASQALEPLSLGTPLLVNASAGELVEVCRAAAGGLYYGNYEEFEAILELALTDPALFTRLGECGREYSASRNDWTEVVAAYDRAFRSFSRPRRASGRSAEASPPPAVPPAPEPAPETAPSPEPTETDEPAPGDSAPGEAEPPPGGAEPPPDTAAETPAETPDREGSDAAPAAEPDAARPAESDDGEPEDERPSDGPLSGFFGSSIRR